MKELPEKIKLNIGCGFKHKKGFINIDIAEECNPDIILDLNHDNLPFEDDTVDYIYSFHCFEHLYPLKFKKVLEELYRVSKHNCIWEIHVPNYYSTLGTNFLHFIPFNVTSFHPIFHSHKHPEWYQEKMKGDIFEVNITPSNIGRLIPTNWLRRKLSLILWQIVIGIEYKIRIIKKEENRE